MTEIEETASDGTAAPVLSFEYSHSSDTNKTFESKSSGLPSFIDGHEIKGRGIRFGDIDGNGTIDAVISQQDVDETEPENSMDITAVYLNDGDGNFTEASG